MNEDGGSCAVLKMTEWKVAVGTMSIYCSVSRNCYLLPLSSARVGAELVLCCAHPYHLSRSIVTTFVIGCLHLDPRLADTEKCYIFRSHFRETFLNVIVGF